jgi:cbb3-type cytochrome oxidase subunit 1
MGEVLKSSRFWIALVICGGIIAFCILGKIGGKEAIAALGLILAGFGVGKTGSAGKLDALIAAGVKAGLAARDAAEAAVPPATADPDPTPAPDPAPAEGGGTTDGQ